MSSIYRKILLTLNNFLQEIPLHKQLVYILRQLSLLPACLPLPPQWLGGIFIILLFHRAQFLAVSSFSI